MTLGGAAHAARRFALRHPRVRSLLARTLRRINARLLRRSAAIDQAFVEGRWQDVVAGAESMERDLRVRFSPRFYLQWSVSYAHLGNNAAAGAVLERAASRMPRSQLVLRNLAEWAMHRRDYPRALGYWQRYAVLTQTGRQDGALRREPAFPVRGTDIDWYEIAWAQVVSDWDRWWEGAGTSATPLTYARVLSTLVQADLVAGVIELSQLALRDHPNDHELALRIADALARVGVLAGPNRLDGLLPAVAAGPASQALTSAMASAQSLLTDLEHEKPHRHDLRILNVAHLSGADFAIRSGNYWDERRISEAALTLAMRDQWPEGFAQTDLLSEEAWRLSVRFARSRADRLGVSEETLARSVFHFVKNELCLKLPTERLAEEIAATDDGEPVLIELPGLKMHYLGSYASSRFQPLYLYFELRRLGCNVFLVRFPSVRVTSSDRGIGGLESETLVISPQVSGLRPQFRAVEEEPHTPRVLVPAGIRSVSGVLHLVEPALVVNSGSVIKGLAYDRSFRQGFDFPVHAEVHPPANLLPTFRFELHPRKWWVRSSAKLTAIDSPDFGGHRVEARLMHAHGVERNWSDLLAEVLLPYFDHYIERADEFLAERNIDEIHIGDYLYAEPTLLASRVKRRGGTVHVWPHSTNPVHVPFHDPDLIDSVHTITRTGAKVWRERLPNAVVEQAPQLMLGTPQATFEWQATEPLSVVVIGGRPKLRNLPILDIATHEETYREVFTALAPLVEAGLLRVFFKPRGLTGEHEQWLDGVVGRTANWSRVLAHPNRLALANPLFMSISVSSSALLEGIARGIPGVVVRGGHAREYIPSDGTVEELRTGTVAKRMAELSNRASWSRLRDFQMASLSRELRQDDDV